MMLLLPLLAALLSSAIPTSGYLSESWALLNSANSAILGGTPLGFETTHRCVDIPDNLTLCHGMEYTKMRLPNLLEHDTMAEAIEQSAPWRSLINLHCNLNTQRFLCSLFAPVCLPDMAEPIYPCRSLCLQVQNSCESRMKGFGFDWPDMLNCSRFPADSLFCVGATTTTSAVAGTSTTPAMTTTSAEQRQGATSTNTQQRPSTPSHFPSGPGAAIPALPLCEACSQPATYENIVDHFCRAQHVIRARGVIEPASGVVKLRGGRMLKGSTPTLVATPGRDERHVSIFSSASELCRCDLSPAMPANEARPLLVMASAKMAAHNGLPVATLILPWNREKKFRRAVRTMRAGLNCARLGREIRESHTRRSVPPYLRMRANNRQIPQY